MRELRILNISGWDVEACGGTHTSRTGDIGFIKILRSERVQDGVERIEFVAGEPALAYVQARERTLSEISDILEAPQDKAVKATYEIKKTADDLKKRQRQLIKRLSTYEVEDISKRATEVGGLKLYMSADEGLDEEYHVTVGEEAIKADPSLIYCGFAAVNGSVRLFVFCGEEARAKGLKAGELVREIAKVLGGSGGGDPRFGQGGGRSAEKIGEAMEAAKHAVSSSVAGSKDKK